MSWVVIELIQLSFNVNASIGCFLVFFFSFFLSFFFLLLWLRFEDVNEWRLRLFSNGSFSELIQVYNK
jgi:hypothetical protein